MIYLQNFTNSNYLKKISIGPKKAIRINCKAYKSCLSTTVPGILLFKENLIQSPYVVFSSGYTVILKHNLIRLTEDSGGPKQSYRPL